MKKWDKNIDFNSLKQFLEKEIEKLENMEKSVSVKKKITILYCLYTQLLNGSRVSESVDAIKSFFECGKREVEVRIRKRKDGKTRIMVIPSIVKKDNIVISALKVINVKVYAQKLGINTHTLRYAFITYLSRKNVNPLIISKITGHKKLDTLLEYIQEKIAQDVLRGISA